MTPFRFLSSLLSSKKDKTTSTTLGSSTSRSIPVRTQTILLSTKNSHLSLHACMWEVLCITLKLAKVFPYERCLALQSGGDTLTLLELQKIKIHIETVLFPYMEEGDYLMSDLTLCDQHPEKAFPHQVRMS